MKSNAIAQDLLDCAEGTGRGPDTELPHRLSGREWASSARAESEDAAAHLLTGI
jgi:hypothetical protein